MVTFFEGPIAELLLTIKISTNHHGFCQSVIIDGFVKSPTSALRFISLSLRRTISTLHDTKFARLEFGAFYFAVGF